MVLFSNDDEGVTEVERFPLPFIIEFKLPRPL